VVLQRIPNADTLLQVEMEEGKLEGKMGRTKPATMYILTLWPFL